MASIVAIFLLAAPAEYFGWFGTKDLFPFYHWELGFGEVFSNSNTYEVYITKLDNKPISPPQKISDILSEKWEHTVDYKIAKAFARKLRRFDSNIDQTRATFELEVFKNNGYKQATYFIRHINYDSLQFYNTGEIVNFKDYGSFEYHE